MRRAALALALLAAACSGASHAVTKDGKPVAGAEADYLAGEAELKDRNWTDAQKAFERIRTKYPFSKYAALAELRLADGKYGQDKFLEAADAYQQFVKLHPNHEEVDYAAFRVGLCRYKDAPTDFMLFPAAYERDNTSLVGAATAIEGFLKGYPQSKYAPEAKKLLAETQRRFADREWYVAQFYFKRGRWPGVAGRLERLLKDYPGSSHETEALLQLAQTYLKMDERFRAKKALQQLIVKYPQDPRRPEAEKLLASIR
jgi:outer membrane protein assembly factor BamD